MRHHIMDDRYTVALQMGYWPATQQAALFAKEPNRTQRVLMCQGQLISEVEFWLEEQGWVVGYMLGYNDGKTGLHTKPEEAVAAHRSRALVLHPDVAERDSYGVLTLGVMFQYRLWAEGWLAGHRKAGEDVFGPETWAKEQARYADVRDALLGLCDMPFTMACAIALWLDRESVICSRSPDDSGLFWVSFPQVL
jgi:hypothetical protein